MGAPGGEGGSLALGPPLHPSNMELTSYVWDAMCLGGARLGRSVLLMPDGTVHTVDIPGFGSCPANPPTEAQHTPPPSPMPSTIPPSTTYPADPPLPMPAPLPTPPPPPKVPQVLPQALPTPSPTTPSSFPQPTAGLQLPTCLQHRTSHSSPPTVYPALPATMSLLAPAPAYIMQSYIHDTVDQLES